TAAALAVAAAGDTVRLTRGVHEGRVTIDQPIILLGDPGATIDGGGRGTVITVTADSVTIRGLEIRNSGRSLDHDDAAIKLVRCTGCVVVDNSIAEPAHGIYLLESRAI